MNYLAHAYLSFNKPDILVGNLICDFVKGRTKFQYPIGIQKGMELHRAIDYFTDTHEVTQQAKKYFKPAYRLYAGAFVDITYDYFLANDTQQFFNANQLLLFSNKTYAIIDGNTVALPEKFEHIFPYMKNQNWLYNYQFVDGVEKSYQGLVKRSAYLSNATLAMDVFKQHTNELQLCYQIFFPQLKNFVLNWFTQNGLQIQL